MSTTALISHSDCHKHEMHDGHPESPARLDAILGMLTENGIAKRCLQHEAPLATREQLERVHDAAYLDLIEASAPASGLAMLDPDTAMNPFSLSAASHAAGAVVHATNLVISGQADSAFCAIRPPGHHAEHDRAMGFCLYNNIAVGAAHALDKHGLERVAILDFDVHHGNGTENIFHDDPRVLFCSTFQHPFYPMSNPVSNRSHIIKCPLEAGSSSDTFCQAILDKWIPAIADFAPEMIFISAGFDAHREDFLASLNLSDDDYGWVTQEIVQLAAEHCDGRIVSALEGGYHTAALARSVSAHIEALLA